jgi:uncharacterized Ntn-hydrolase superfamily protein
MESCRQDRNRSRLFLTIIVLIPVMVTFTYALYANILDVGPTSSRSSTWSIVALDPETGDVGAAGASCVPVNATVLAALVPGHGAAAIQAEFDIENRDRAFELLKMGLQAEEVRDLMTEKSADTGLSFRQYGIVTMKDGVVQAAGYTGDRNFSWASDEQDVSAAVSVQGNTLESEDVIKQALEAFHAADLGPIPLPDRLIRALEAGSTAGGDKRCNQDDFQQTALTAFIAVSKADQAPFAAPFSESTEIESPNLPWLYAAVIEEQGGPNPIIELRRQYDRWRESHLAPCPLCEMSRIEVPLGRVDPDEPISQSTPRPTQTLEPEQPRPVPQSTEADSESAQIESTESIDGSTTPAAIFLLLTAAAVIVGMALYLYIRRSRTIGP